MTLLNPKTSALRRRASERGLATVLVIAIIGIFCIVLTANVESVRRAFKEVKRVEAAQLHHSPWLLTNPPPSQAESK